MDFTLMKSFMDRLTNWRIPGNAISVFQDHKEIFRYNAGFADVENQIPMSPEHVVNLYSCSKVATVVAALQLYEKGLFLLDDPLYSIFPEYRHMTVKEANGHIRPAKTNITIRHIFTMTAGLSYDGFPGLNSTATRHSFDSVMKDPTKKADTVTMMRALAQDPLSFDPGTHFQYSLCHDVLAAVVEEISGERFGEYVRKHIFAPLEMRTATSHYSEETLSKMAQQYNFVEGGKNGITTPDGTGVWENVGKMSPMRFGDLYESGGAFVICSIEDYAKFGDALACGGVGANGERILASGTIDLLRANQLTGDALIDLRTWPQLHGYGYGLGVRTMMDRAASGSNGSVGEFGWGGAAGGTLLVDPDRHFSYFYAHHMLNQQETYYQPRLRNVAYACLG